MKISIALATYNGAKYLPEQLQSYLSQNRLPDELVVNDDFSTDNTIEIIEQFAKLAPFDVFIHRNRENIGWGRNFSAALMKTTGDLVFLSDQDDVWFPEKIEYIENLALKHPDIYVIMNDALLTDSELTVKGLSKLEQIRSAGYSDTKFVMGSCSAVRRELLDLCLPVPEGFREHDVWIKNFAENLSGRLISKKALQYYRRHGNNVSNSITSKTRKVRFSDRLQMKLKKNLTILSGSEKYDQSFKKLELFSGGVEAALLRKEGRHQEALKNLLEKLHHKMNCLRIRKKIRSQPLFKRTSAVMKHYISGTYKEASGLKSALRDLLG